MDEYVYHIRTEVDCFFLVYIFEIKEYKVGLKIFEINYSQLIQYEILEKLVTWMIV